jgi:hypothetical protein
MSGSSVNASINNLSNPPATVPEKLHHCGRAFGLLQDLQPADGAFVKLVLTQGKVALVDDVDTDLVDFKWFAQKVKGKSSLRWYADRHGPMTNGRRRSVRMHRVILERILGRSLEKQEQVDHINHNGLDNRRSNLRLATCQENHYNRRSVSATKSSSFKGVTFRKQKSKWEASIKVNGRTKYLGAFDVEEDAARAYDEAAKRIFRQYCCANFQEVSQ